MRRAASRPRPSISRDRPPTSTAPPTSRATAGSSTPVRRCRPRPEVDLAIPVGAHEVTLAVADQAGSFGADTATIRIEDTQGPVITIVEPRPVEYLHSATIVLDYGVTDACTGVDSFVATIDGAASLGGSRSRQRPSRAALDRAGARRAHLRGRGRGPAREWHLVFAHVRRRGDAREHSGRRPPVRAERADQRPEPGQCPC